MLDEQEIGGGAGDEGASNFVRGGTDQRPPDSDREADQENDEDPGDGETRQTSAPRIAGLRVTSPS